MMLFTVTFAIFCFVLMGCFVYEAIQEEDGQSKRLREIGFKCIRMPKVCDCGNDCVEIWHSQEISLFNGEKREKDVSVGHGCLYCGWVKGGWNPMKPKESMASFCSRLSNESTQNIVDALEDEANQLGERLSVVRAELSRIKPTSPYRGE